jgi:hypothetical protein
MVDKKRHHPTSKREKKGIDVQNNFGKLFKKKTD